MKHMSCINFPVRIDDQLLIALTNHVVPYEPCECIMVLASQSQLNEYSTCVSRDESNVLSHRLAIRSDVFSNRGIV